MRVFRSDHEEASGGNGVLEESVGRAELIDAGLDVHARGPREELPAVRFARGNERGKARTDPGEKRIEEGIVTRGIEEFVHRGGDRPALAVSEDDDEADAKTGHGKGQAGDLRRGREVAGDTDDEKIARPLVEHDLGRDARVGASEHRGLRPRGGGQLKHGARGCPAGEGVHEAAVALAEFVEDDVGRNGGGQRRIL